MDAKNKIGFYTGLFALGVIFGAALLWYGERNLPVFGSACKECKDCCQPGVISPRDGLAVGKWYRAKTRLVWSVAACAWVPGDRGDGFSDIPAGTPVFVLERRGNTALVRGASRELAILIPDGVSVLRFAPIVGDLPPDREPAEPIGEEKKK